MFSTRLVCEELLNTPQSVPKADIPLSAIRLRHLERKQNKKARHFKEHQWKQLMVPVIMEPFSVTLMLYAMFCTSVVTSLGWNLLKKDTHFVTPEETVRILEQASLYFGKNVESIALISESPCLSTFRPNTLRSSIITHDDYRQDLLGVGKPYGYMILPLMSQRDRIILQCKKYVYATPVIMSCRVLFTLCLLVSSSGCRSQFSTIFMMPNKTVKSISMIESDDCLISPRVLETYEGIRLPLPRKRCWRLIDIRPHTTNDREASLIDLLKMRLTISNGILNKHNESKMQSETIGTTMCSTADSQRTIATDRLICVIPARRYRPSSKTFAVFSLPAWFAIICFLTAVCFFVSFPSVRAAVELEASMVSSLLSPFTVRLNQSLRGFPTTRHVAFMVAYFMTHTVLLNIYRNEITSELSKTHDETPGCYTEDKSEAYWPEFGEHFVTPQLIKMKSVDSFNYSFPYCTRSRSSVSKLFFMKPLVVGVKLQYCRVGLVGCMDSLYQPDVLRSLQKFGLITSKPVHGRSIGEIRDKIDSDLQKLIQSTDDGGKREYDTWTWHRSLLRENFDALIDVDDGADLMSLSQMLIIAGVIALLHALSCALFTWESIY